MTFLNWIIVISYAVYVYLVSLLLLLGFLFWPLVLAVFLEKLKLVIWSKKLRWMLLFLQAVWLWFAIAFVRENWSTSWEW